MIITPNTEVRLLSAVPLTNSYEHQLTFDSVTEQTDYFYNKVSYYSTDCTYQREDTSIRFPGGRDKLYACNYLMYRNKDFSDKWFYGFITKLEYVNPEMTKIHFEQDVFQTWMFDFTLKPSFVEREHAARWNADGTPVINTVDEGLNYGTEYNTLSITQYIPFTDVYFLVIVCKQRMDVNGSNIEPVVNGSIQPLTYYVQPFKMDGSVPSITIDGTPQTLSSVKDVLTALYSSTVAVNNVANLYITEYIGQDSLNFSMAEFEPVNVQKDSTNFVTLRVVNLPQYKTIVKDFGNKYDGFANVTESKLLMHPYTLTVLTDLKGNYQEIKNEYIQDTNLKVTVKGSMGTSNKVAYQVNNYLMGSIDNAGEVALEHAVVNNSPNDVPIITDLLAAYLQGNRNAIENQKASILFNQIAGTIGGGLGTIMQSKMMGGLGASQGLAESAQNLGNGYFQMAGLMAKQKDIANTPPTIAKQGSNTAFDYGNDLKGLYVIKKQITPEYQKKLTDFFKMYGYKISEVKTPNLNSRQHFNFIKTVGAYVTGNVPQDDLLKIKAIFDNGVTLWHGDWVGDYSLANGEV